MKRNIITICIFSVLFFSSYVLFTSPFELYLPYVFIILLLPFFLGKYPFPIREFRNILLPLLFFGIISIMVKDNTVVFFVKIWLNFAVFALFFHYVFCYYNYDIQKIFGYYMKGAYFITLLGLFQVISYNLNFKFGYTLGNNFFGILNKWGVVTGEGPVGVRMNSLFSEPSYFGASIAPAFFVSLYNLVKQKELFISKLKSLIILVTFFFTGSSVGYTGVFACIVILLLYLGFVRYVVVIGPLLIFGYLYMYNNVPEFRERADGIFDLSEGKATKGLKVHGSSFVLYNNWVIAKENMIRNPLWGTGLGSHQIAYEKYSISKKYEAEILDANQQDANSMFLRLMSETGLFGVILMLALLYGCFVKRAVDDANEMYWVICGATFVVIFLQLFRQGNYTYNGFFFYLYLYYYNFKQNKEFMKNHNPEATNIEPIT